MNFLFSYQTITFLVFIGFMLVYIKKQEAEIADLREQIIAAGNLESENARLLDVIENWKAKWQEADARAERLDDYYKGHERGKNI